MMSVPVITIEGAHDGPTLYLGGAIHGNELTGTGAILRVADIIDEKKLHGKLVMVPVQNIPAYFNRTRVDFDITDPKIADLNRNFPGKSSGKCVERIADGLFKLVSKADYVIDLHASTAGVMYPYVIETPATSNQKPAVRKKIQEMCKVFGLPIHRWIIDETTYGGWRAGYAGAMVVVASEQGIPGVMVEAGRSNVFEDKFIDPCVTGILNVMKHLKMIDGTIQASSEPFVGTKEIDIKTNHGGLLFIRMESLGTRIRKGDLLGHITNLFGEVVERITAPVDGLVIRLLTLASIREGDSVAYILY